MSIIYYRDTDGHYVGAFDAQQDGLIECDPPQDARQTWNNVTGEWSDLETVQDYRIGKSVPFRRMTDTEAVTVELLIASASAKFRLIWGAASYIDTRDELFPVLETMLSGALGAERAAQLLAAE